MIRAELSSLKPPKSCTSERADCSCQTGDDWLEAGKILNSLLRGLKSKRGGRTPRLHPLEKQRIIRDVLIARTVKRAGALLVTDDARDFKVIKQFCNLRIQSGREYFGQPKG